MAIPPPSPIPQVTAPALRDRIEAGEPIVLLDVREDVERGLCAIPAAGAADLHVPLGQLVDRLSEIQAATGPDRALVVYCHLGQRSQLAAAWLSRAGLPRVENLYGGIEAWSTLVDRSVPRY